jgi:NOL1/NOP2/sun family putative RNA methylase
MDLPQEFLLRMQDMLGEEYEAFLQTYEEPRRFGLRVNTLKISVEEFVKLAPFHLTRIPWIDNGFYYEREDDPARHPFYYAGLYYLQEPSAMTPASLLPVDPGEHVLDLCAAPGGKATALAAKLQGRGLLVANDISASRAKALLKNLEVFGVKNSFVTNAVPARLAEQFPEAFDKILVDAPCSGEGMFRKDIANAKAWSPEKVETCAKTQREITQQAVKMLRPGGLMLYSTCTFAREENEETIADLLEQCPEMELLELPWRDGFMHGFAPYEKCARIFPHKMGGEGHFLALLKKKGELSGIHQKVQRSSGRPSREEEKVLREFLQDVSMDWSMEQIEVRGGQAYFIPEPPDIRGKIPFLRNGLYLGEIKKNRFEPSQSFAVALKKDEYASVVDLHYEDERVRRYLCGETVEVDDLPVKRDKGWQLVCVDGYPLGWGKLVNGTLKNKYHPGWRMQQ